MNFKFFRMLQRVRHRQQHRQQQPRTNHVVERKRNKIDSFTLLLLFLKNRYKEGFISNRYIDLVHCAKSDCDVLECAHLNARFVRVIAYPTHQWWVTKRQRMKRKKNYRWQSPTNQSMSLDCLLNFKFLRYNNNKIKQIL